MDTLALLLVFVLCISLIAFAWIVLTQNLLGVPPYVPSFNKNIKQAFQNLDIEDKKFVDLGSGDGKIVLLAAQQGMQATGVEINPFLVLLTKLRSLLTPSLHTKFKWQSFAKTDLGSYDIVFTYLFPQTMAKLAPKLKEEMKPGSILISNTFSLPNKDVWQTFGEVKVYRF